MLEKLQKKVGIPGWPGSALDRNGAPGISKGGDKRSGVDGCHMKYSKKSAQLKLPAHLQIQINHARHVRGYNAVLLTARGAGSNNFRRIHSFPNRLAHILNLLSKILGAGVAFALHSPDLC